MQAPANSNIAPKPALRCFEVGETYSTRSPCDADCIVSITVARRTAKMIVTTEGKRFYVAPDWQGEAETVKPWGSYSMCPVISA